MIRTAINDNKTERKVGIVTLTGDFNYGNKLQLFAAINIYRSLGFAPEFLAYDHKDSELLHPKLVIKNLRAKVCDAKEAGRDSRSLSGNESAKHAAFVRFNAMIPTRHVSNPTDIDPAGYSYFSVGSDQVWNPALIFAECSGRGVRRAYESIVDPLGLKYAMDWYFLRFADEKQRLTMAPSIGLDELDSVQQKRLAEGIRGFNKISIREKRGADLIRECSGREATVICDPTLVLTADMWSSIMDDRFTPKHEYVLSYILGGKTRESEHVLDAATNHGEIPLIELSDKGVEDNPIGPSEFVSLIAHASNVITDSFHATVFASIYERPLTIVHRGGSASLSMFSRLESLCQTLGITNKIYSGEVFDQGKYSDFDGVQDAIESQRARFLEFVEAGLSV